MLHRKMAIAQEGKELTGSRRSSLPLILSTVAVTIAVAGFALLLTRLGHEKIGVVRTSDLVAKYKGMEDARGIFEGQRKKWQGEIDTLEADYRKSVSELNAAWGSLTEGERAKREELVNAQRENLARYGQSLEERTHEEEEKLMQGVLHQVNQAIREYAESKGYDAIYGATPDGSILYGSDGLDITDELIAELNRKYTGVEKHESEVGEGMTNDGQPGGDTSYDANDTGR